MKIHVDKISEEGLELIEQIDPRKISHDLDKKLVNFISPIDVEAKVIKRATGVFVDVRLEVPCEYTCARCLAKIQDIFKKHFDLMYDVKPGDILELDEDIRQEIILDCPIKTVCKSDCKGLCPNCGQNLNIARCECRNAGPIKNRPFG